MRHILLGLIAAPLLAFGVPKTTHSAPTPIESGNPAPAFDLPVFDAPRRHMTLDSLRGKVVLLDFWASWCGPCRQSFPLYEQLRSELPASDFTLLAIDLDDVVDGPRAFLEEHPVHYTSLADPAGNVARAYGLRGMPTSFVIDRDGIVRAHHTGFKPQDMKDIRAEIRALLDEDAAVADEAGHAQ